MPKFNILPREMILYSAAEPAGRTFLAGEMWPGDSWHDAPGGKPVGEATTAAAMKELIEANDRIDALGAQVAGLQHSAAQADARAEAALSGRQELEQRLRDAERAAAEVSETAAVLTKERDQARAHIETLQRQLTAQPNRKGEKPALEAASAT